MTRKISQIEQVKKHLLKHKSITSWEAIKVYAITRLAPIIFILKNHGWKIKATKMTGKDSNFVRYFLTEKP